MDGLNFRMAGDVMKSHFHQDSYGSFIPSRDNLQMSAVEERMRKQLNAKHGLYDRLAEIYERTDVQFTDNPLGNTPVIGVGYKLFGKRPLNVKMKGKISRLEGRGQNLTAQLDAREKRIEANQQTLMNLHKQLEPSDKNSAEYLNWLVEGDQVMTGGGFDNNAVGEVNKSALNFVIDSSASIDYEDSDLSRIVVEGALWVKKHLMDSGMTLGSLGPMGASVVRAEQDTDGMFGWPVYSKGNDALTPDLAKRLLIESGVDCGMLVGTPVVDHTTKAKHEYRVIDAGGHILDNKIFTPDDIVSLVTLLARIQKHGWKKENGVLTAKPGKTRSVYPNAFLPAVIEAMIMTPFNNEIQRLKVKMMPSVQDKPTRVAMIKDMILRAMADGYDYLAADWSKYDASVKGSILATIIQLAVKPFFQSKYHFWVDAATYILTYKYIITETSLCELFPDMYSQANSAARNIRVKNYTVYGLVDGLISGAKFTHVGGSIYGEVVIHYGIPSLLGFEPIIGPQAGDDTLMGVPLARIDTSSVSKTYDPIIAAAERFGLHANSSKQIWHQVGGEVVKVFLQDNYHAYTKTWGIGSAFRPASAIFFSEREKGLTVSLQLMAEIARMNQGADSPFIKPVVEWWISKERYLGWLFKRYGVSGFGKLSETIDMSASDMVKSIDVGSFTFGVEKSDIEAGTLPILDVMADVSSQLTFSSEDSLPSVVDLEQGKDTDVGDIEESLGEETIYS